MSVTPPQGPNPAERAELAGLLPAPGDPDLSGSRHRLLKEHLMLEIQEPAPTRRPRRRLAVAALAVPLAAAAVAGAVAVGTDGGGRPRPVAVDGPAPRNAAMLLDRISLVAANKPAVTVRDDQFIYTKTKQIYTEIVTGRDRKRTVTHGKHAVREAWVSPLPTGVDGMMRENGGPLDGVTGENVYSYKRVSAFPTDPDAILRRIYRERKNRKGDDQSKEGLAFDEIGKLVNESILPPGVTAALYRAAARIPGVVMVPDAVDAAGRHGVAVSRVTGAGRTEWIFDRKTFAYLGSRTVLVKDTDEGRKGTLIGHSALLASGVVDKPGQLPR
ncbi:CU044_5270 family protein [Actinomadura macrotermitis]|uniref:CU044_5270 family protein n=1 Tax=Actinomadura macrotermitis TaxID=2585200 RepID=A0A7K0BVH6_9ACTN|nr:CU044_5270 family protein [Actinomadura macrotermitis]MQY05179.1 hypothetical protein [Actinomadura macrotermitis]